MQLSLMALAFFTIFFLAAGIAMPVMAPPAGAGAAAAGGAGAAGATSGAGAAAGAAGAGAAAGGDEAFWASAGMASRAAQTAAVTLNEAYFIVIFAPPVEKGAAEFTRMNREHSGTLYRFAVSHKAV
jgi:hypothetical protein